MTEYKRIVLALLGTAAALLFFSMEATAAGRSTSTPHNVPNQSQPSRNRGYPVPTTGQSPYYSGQSNPYYGGSGPSIPRTDHQQNRTRQLNRYQAR